MSSFNELTKEQQRSVFNRAYLRHLAMESKNTLERFVVQQNYIQYLLADIVILRSGFPDKELINYLQKTTIGTLILFYRATSEKNDDEAILISALDKYNEKRNYLTHKLLRDSSGMSFEKEAESANKIGAAIMKILDTYIDQKLKRHALHKALVEYGEKPK